VQPLETRSAGQAITTLVNLLFSFVIGQARCARSVPDYCLPALDAIVLGSAQGASQERD
jgi:hypothetical protein